MFLVFPSVSEHENMDVDCMQGYKCLEKRGKKKKRRNLSTMSILSVLKNLQSGGFWSWKRVRAEFCS